MALSLGGRVVRAGTGTGSTVVVPPPPPPPPGTGSGPSGIDPPAARAGKTIFYENHFTSPIPVTDAASRYDGTLGSHTATAWLDPSHVREDTANSQLVIVGSMDPAVWANGKTSTRNGVTYTAQNKFITGGISFGNLAARTPAYPSFECMVRMDAPPAGQFGYAPSTSAPGIGYVFNELYGPGTWPDCGETDAVEGTMGTNTFAMNLHYGPAPAGATNIQVLGTNKTGIDQTKWHRYRVEFKPGASGQGPTVTAYVDDVVYQTRTNLPAAFATANLRWIIQQEAKQLPTTAQLAYRGETNIYFDWLQIQV